MEWRREACGPWRRASGALLILLIGGLLTPQSQLGQSCETIRHRRVDRALQLRGGIHSGFSEWQGLLKWSLEYQKQYERVMNKTGPQKKIDPEDLKFLTEWMERNMIDTQHMIECSLVYLSATHRLHPKLNKSSISPDIKLIEGKNFTRVEPRKEAWRKIKSEGEAIECLQDMIESIDASIRFGELGGLNVIHAWLLHEQKNLTLKAEALSVVTLACQNNPVVCRTAVRMGLVESLFAIISSHAEVAFPSKYDTTQPAKPPLEFLVMKRAIWALSAIMVMDPEATLRLINTGCLPLLRDLLDTGRKIHQQALLQLIESMLWHKKLTGVGNLLLKNGFAPRLIKCLEGPDPVIRQRTMRIFCGIVHCGDDERRAVRELNVHKILCSQYLSGNDQMVAKSEPEQLLTALCGHSELRVDPVTDKEYIDL